MNVTYRLPAEKAALEPEPPESTTWAMSVISISSHRLHPWAIESPSSTRPRFRLRLFLESTAKLMEFPALFPKRK